MKRRTPPPPTEIPELRASDVQKAAGLSYRQLNDWGSKGALPDDRDSERHWRKFTTREVFALMVCSDLRKLFGVAVKDLKYIRAFMLQESADHLLSAVDLMKRGLTVWLMTDCRRSFVMDSDLEFADLFRNAGFRGEGQSGFMMLPINPIVRRLVAAMKDPIDLSPLDDTYRAIAKARAGSRLSAEGEQALIQLVRDPANEAVNCNLKEGKVVQATAKKRPLRGSGRESTERGVLDLLHEHRFQTLTVRVQDGRIVDVEQNVPIRMQDTERQHQAPRTQRKNSERPSGK